MASAIKEDFIPAREMLRRVLFYCHKEIAHKKNRQEDGCVYFHLQ